QAQIDPIGKEAVNRDRCQLERPGPQDGAAELPGNESADVTEEQWREIDQTKSAHAGHKRKPAAKGEVAARKCAQINDRTGICQAADDEAGAGEWGKPSATCA